MREKIGSSKILAVRLTADINSMYDNYDNNPTVKASFLDKIFGTKKNNKKLNIGDVILSSMLVSSSHHDEIIMKNADYLLDINTKHFGLLQLKESEKLVNFSYEICMKYLSESLHK